MEKCAKECIYMLFDIIRLLRVYDWRPHVYLPQILLLAHSELLFAESDHL